MLPSSFWQFSIKETNILGVGIAVAFREWT